jgi:hypothetical protein
VREEDKEGIMSINNMKNAVSNERLGNISKRNATPKRRWKRKVLDSPFFPIHLKRL